jgi:hypothetical protein
VAAAEARFQTDFGAVPAWPEGATPSYLGGPPTWTVDLEERWVHSDRPVTTRVELVDIMSDSIGYVTVFRSTFLTDGERTFWMLRTSDSLVSNFRQRRPEVFDTYLIVAQVSRVRRPSVGISAEAYEDPTVSQPELEPVAADYFLVTGELLASAPLSF